MKFTENQLNAINTDNQNILVSAGAGSGKTSVLTNRVLRKLNDGISIDRLIILTFTNAAADEMKDRIKKTILLNPKLHNEMKRLDNAIISTFDAFCLRLVKTYHYRLNLPGTIQISDHVILEKAKRFCLDETLKKYYGEKTPLFKNLISRLFDKGDELLQTTILSFASGIEMIPDMFDFLSSYETNYLSNESIEKALTDFEKMIFSDIAEMNPFLDELIQDFKIYNDDKINQYLLEMSSNYQRLFKSIDLDEIIQLLQNFNHPRIPRFHKEFDENITDSLKQKNSDIKNKLNSIIGYFDKLFVKNKKDILKSIKETNCIILSVVQITKDYLTLLKDYKKRNSIFSFTDIMNYSIELFENCPDVTQYYQKNISEIMIDEYQDTNDLQEYLISLIQHSNLFMVGDIKQSIYGFRNANPDNFRMKRKQYKETNLGIAIDLMENFRSRKEVLNGVNQLFITIMDEKIGGVNYHENQSLIYGNFEYDLEFSAFQDYTPTILTYDNESLEAFDSKTNSAYIEGLIIAKDIRFKIDSGFQIFNREDKKYELATYQDFVILIDRKSNFDQYQKALIKYKVPVEKIADEDFSQSTEILFLNQYITLLKCFNDDLFFSKHFKGSFYGVARSFVYQIPDEQLIQLFLDYPKITKNIILELSEMNSFKQIINDLNIIVEKMYKVPAHKLLQMIYDQLQLFKSVAMLDNPEVAEAKLDFLIAKVEELAYFSVNDLFEYFSFLYDNPSIDIEYSKSSAKGLNSTKLMTMHKSKGLEFPICYYAGLDKKFNYSENKSFFVFDKEYGLITKSFDNGFKDTIYHILLKRKNYQSYVSERIRLFYVALTRAKEKMILVTNVSKWKNTNLIYNNLGYLDVGIRRKFSSYTDVLSSIPSLSSWFQNIDIKYESIQPDSQIALSNKFEPVSYLKFNFDAFCKEEYHFSKNSISLYSKAEKEAMHFGTMLHEALEHFDFKNVDASLSNLPVFLQDKLKPLLISFPFQNIEEAEIYQEYEFYDETIDTTQSGIIDLMLVYKSKVYLIDYKLKNTDESAYLIQLNGYADYIRKITKKPVDTYLYSLLTNELICLKED